MNKSILGIAFGLAMAGAATPAQSAQIMLTSANIIGSLSNPYTSPVPIFDQQSGDVTAAGAAWTAGASALVTIDLGQAYDLGRFDFFTSDTIKFTLIGGNNVGYNGWGSYFINGSTVLLAQGDLAADAGNVLTAQSFGDQSASQTFRYIQLDIYDATVSREYILNELRIFDNATPAVPEPASWALMIAGFGAVGAGLRRRKLTDRMAIA